MSQAPATTLWGRRALAVCAAAAVLEVVLSAVSTETLRWGDVPLALFVVAPFALLSGLTWWCRQCACAAKALLVLALVLAAWGLYAFGMEGYYYHTDLDYRRLQRTTAFVVPTLQGAAVLAMGVILALWRRSRRSA